MHKKHVFVVIIIMVSVVFFNCKSKKVDNKDGIDITFTEKKVTKEFNSPDKSKLLILDYLQSKNPLITFNYKVVDIKTKEELISGTFSGIRMEWNDNKSIKGHKYVGMAEADNDEVLIEGNKIKNKNITVIQIK